MFYQQQNNINSVVILKAQHIRILLTFNLVQISGYLRFIEQYDVRLLTTGVS